MGFTEAEVAGLSLGIGVTPLMAEVAVQTHRVFTANWQLAIGKWQFYREGFAVRRFAAVTHPDSFPRRLLSFLSFREGRGGET